MKIDNRKPTKISIKIGGKKVYPELENLVVTPRKEEQKFKSEKYYGYNEVTVKGVADASEDLDDVLNEQNNLITEQEITIADIIEALENKSAGGAEVATPKVEDNTLKFIIGKVEGGVLSL